MNRLQRFLIASAFLILAAAPPLVAQQDENSFVGLLRDLASDDQPLVWTDGPHVSLELPINPPSHGYGWDFSPILGVELKWKRLVTKANASYGFARKVNDNAQVPHEKGHTRNVGGAVLFRVGGRNYLGGGAGWGETSTTPYRKYSWEPQISFMHEFNLMRLQVSYFRSEREYTVYPSPIVFTPGPGQPEYSTYCICSNGGSGVQMQGWTAAPARNGLRFFQLHYKFTIDSFHDTVTDPYNLYMTRQQKAHRMTGGDITVGLVYRR